MQKKTFKFVGKVKSASGLLKRKVVGKPVLGIITVTGDEISFNSPINQEFKIGGRLTEAPLIRSFFPGREFSGDDYPYVLNNYRISETMSSNSSKLDIALTVFPWTKFDFIRAVCNSKSSFYRFLINKVVVDGIATIDSVENVQ